MTVYLVGAGPGDPGLLTLRAAELIPQADVILYDRLIPQESLERARPDALLVFVGKQSGRKEMAQREINRLLVEHGRRHDTVVRLKGGDPFVFGRGGEEAQVLREAGVDFEVVPGITAGIAAPAYAGIPVTSRELASAVALVAGHTVRDLDWSALAAFPGTLVFYMGVAALAEIAERLRAAGRPPDEPVAVVERGTLPGQRTVLATLADVAERAAEEGIRPPAVSIVGSVAALHAQTAWLEDRPLHGVTVAVARAPDAAGDVAAGLRALGAAVLEAPAVQIEPIATEVPALEHYDAVLFASAGGVDRLFEHLHEHGRDARALAGRRIAASGPATVDALRARGLLPDLVSPRADEPLEALEGARVDRALVVCGHEQREVLGRVGADLLVLCETVAEPLSSRELGALARADWIAFASPAAVRLLAQATGGALPHGPRAASIDPSTSEALRRFGREPDLEAALHTRQGLVEALTAAAATASVASVPA
jgi:uroporphyrinogen III methyltransferase / synthase